MTTYADWARRHPQAAAELAALLTPPVPVVAGDAGSEARVQSLVRLEAASKGYRLYRNNNVALKDETGRLVRAGLGNESKQLSEVLKSSDLVGWRPVLIGPQHIGQTIGQFVSVECKAPSWRMQPADKRAHAQAAWLSLVAAGGGVALFATAPGCLP